MRKLIPARKRIDVTPGESVRIVRELQGLSQTRLSALCGIPQTTISSIENGRVNVGVERAKVLGRCPALPSGCARISGPATRSCSLT
jgi:DNA-binding XRE family transcriptional regulator